MTETDSFTKLHTTKPVPTIKDRAHLSTIYGTEVSWRAGSKSPHLIIGWHTVGNPREKFESVNHLYVKPGSPKDRHCLQNIHRVNAWVVASGHSSLTEDEISTMHHDDDWSFLHGTSLYVVTVERATPDGFGYSHPIVLTRTTGGSPINLEVTPDEAKAVMFK